MSTPADSMSRPDHPDFWLLSQALIDVDAQADAGQAVADIVGRYLDTDSVIYAALQRAQRVIGLTGENSLTAMISGAWVDGLVTGMIVQHLKARDGKVP